MLFVALLSSKPASSAAQSLPRRVEWKWPEGLRPIAEYWLQTSNPSVVSVFEVDNIGPIMAATLPWTDLFDITVVPAIAAEEGLKLASQLMPKT
jgi:hypothetical protein